MANHIDLSWADDDNIWAQDNLFQSDETYKFLHECSRLPSNISSPTIEPPSPAQTVSTAPTFSTFSTQPPPPGPELPLKTSSLCNSRLPIPQGGAGHNRQTGALGRSNRKQKSWKVKQTTLVCSLGQELAKDRVTSLAKRALVGKFYYLKMNKIRLDRWVQDYWKPILGYSPRISQLSNQWLIFHFLSEEDLQQILSTPWILDRGVLMLKQWTPGFHPLKSSFDKRWLWMIMPDFPLELWTHPILETVANTVGKFIFFDKRSLN